MGLELVKILKKKQQIYNELNKIEIWLSSYVLYIESMSISKSLKLKHLVFRYTNDRSIHDIPFNYLVAGWRCQGTKVAIVVCDCEWEDILQLHVSNGRLWIDFFDLF